MADNTNQTVSPTATVLTTDQQTNLPTLIRLCADLDEWLHAHTALALIVCALDGLPGRADDGAAAVITATAELLATVAQSTPTARLYRTAYDSFAIVLPCCGRPIALAIAEAIRHGVEHAGNGLTATLAVGGAPHDAVEAGALLAVCEVQLLGDASMRNRVFTAAPVESLPPTTARLVNLLISRLIPLVELEAQLRETKQQALHDPVTGLPNARSLEQTLPRHLERSIHANAPMALLLVDGDNLKEYNTLYGYTIGNEWIRVIADTLSESLRPGDFVARWMMGDEFIVLLPNTPPAAAREIADRLRASVEQASAARGYPGTISIGIVSIGGEASADAVLECARDALCAAKDLGRNQAVLLESPSKTR